nr:CofH family radical SAM protein [Synechococcus sp. CS-1329]
MTSVRPEPLAPWSWREAAAVLVPPPDAAALEPWRGASLEDLLQALAGSSWPAAGSLVGSAAVGVPDPSLALALCLATDSASRPQLAQQARLEVLREAADQRRRQLAGDTVTYVVNRNLNVSNHCVKHCSFCAFRRDAGSEGAYWLDLDTLQQRAAAAQALGASELCLQGGLNSEARLEGSSLRYHARLLEALAEAAPGIHLHAFSPQELLFIAEQDELPLDTVLAVLEASGLGSIPGTAAEVLSEAVRRELCPEKLSARAWCAVVLQAHSRGLATTATLMAGHLETSADRVAHLLTLVELQRRAWGRAQPGFSEFVLLPYVGEAAPAPLRRRVGRDQPDRADMLVLTAQSRLLLGSWFLNHQPSWVKLGLDGASEALRWGCNDLGGTLMEEHITSMAGARGGTAQSPQQLEAAAAGLGRPVRRRTTLYAMTPPSP